MAGDINRDWRLERMAEFERVIGALYKIFAEKLPRHEEFWKKLSAEEEEHAQWLESFTDLEEAGTASIRTLEFSMREVEEGLDFVKKEFESAKRRDFDAGRAVDIALLVERSILERKFYKIVGSPSDGVRALLESLDRGAREHLARIEGFAKRRRDD